MIACSGPFTLLEFFKNRLAVFFRDARPGVDNSKANLIIVMRHTQANAAVVGEFDRISCKIHQNLT